MADPAATLPHLTVIGRVENRPFTRPGRGDMKIRDVERRAHGEAISSELNTALADQDERRSDFDFDELKALGVIIAIEGVAGFSLRLESLDQQSQHREPRPKWILLSVKPETETTPEVAQIWISDEYRAKFLEIFKNYLIEDTKTGRPSNEALIANMARIRSTVLRDLWQSDGEPPTGRTWWELWLRPEPDAIDLAHKYAEAIRAKVTAKHMRVESRHVVWIEAHWQDLQTLTASAVPVAEIRLPQMVDTVLDLNRNEQAEYAQDLATRITAADPAAPAVCLLDTGIRATHRLLKDSIGENDRHSVVGEATGEGNGHGTRMGSLALFGSLAPLLVSSADVELIHRLESVKFLPDTGQHHDPTSYGVVTAGATAEPEISSRRSRVFCMAITSPPDRPGEPSLWSAAVDALAVGTAVGQDDKGIDLIGQPDDAAKRLFVVCAGNVRTGFDSDYLELSNLNAIEDPAQAWNALVVGAHTDMTDIPTDPGYQGWTALAKEGELSPFSRTSVIAGGKNWPIRPDICMEGGNVLTDGAGDYKTNHPVVSLLAAGHTDDYALATANATSAATAQAARLAARAASTYPSYWPETIRGLLTHAADWTPAMRARIYKENSKRKRELLLRRYGWGVPTQEAVEHSAETAVTMAVQDSFTPFGGRDYEKREFRLHRLPWPTEVLAEIGERDVELRITLSYFVEPSASRRGWRRRYAYASHGLRFDLQRPNEPTADFVRRVNQDAADEEDGDSSLVGDSKWVIGPQQRNRGSLHQDVWRGYGTELAATGGTIAVNAIGGWWKNNRRRDRVDLPVRYSLLVSLRTATEGVNLYASVAAELEVPTEAVAVQS